MGTRSIVAYGSPHSWAGRYVHWDGYPTHMANALWTIAQRDGVNSAATMLTETHTSWSSINPWMSANDVRETTASRLPNFVLGYGVHSSSSEDTLIWSDDKDKHGTEWLYVLGETWDYDPTNADASVALLETLHIARIVPSGTVVPLGTFDLKNETGEVAEPDWQGMWDSGWFQRAYERSIKHLELDVLVRYPSV